MNANIVVPAIDQAFYTDAQVPQIKSKLDSIYNTYKSYIDNIAIISNVPAEILLSFIFIESDGDPNAVSSAGAVGLMQLIPSSASDILVTEKLKKRLNAQEQSIIRKYINGRLDGILKMKYLGDSVTAAGKTSSTWITKEDLLNPELNLVIGSIYLGLLLDQETVIGEGIRMYAVAMRYNKGYYSKVTDNNIADAVANANTETSNYILKLVGTNGVLQQLLA